MALQRVVASLPWLNALLGSDPWEAGHFSLLHISPFTQKPGGKPEVCDCVHVSPKGDMCLQQADLRSVGCSPVKLGFRMIRGLYYCVKTYECFCASKKQRWHHRIKGIIKKNYIYLLFYGMKEVKALKLKLDSNCLNWKIVLCFQDSPLWWTMIFII